MPGKSCPKHPDAESMVPCLECGRYFCSICDPIRGAGQYCPACYRKSLSEMSAGKPQPVPGKRLGKQEGKKEKRASQPPESRPEGREGAGKRSAGLGTARAGVMKKERAKTPGTREPPAERARRLATSAGNRLKALAGQLIPRVGAFVGEHFPLEVVDTRRGEDMPPLARAWYKLLLVVLGGAAAWTAIAAAAHSRVGWYTWIVATVVAVCVVWSLGSRFDVPTAVATMMLTLLSLTLGEVMVHLLYSWNVIKLLDLGYPGEASIFYRDFFYKILIIRMLPSAFIAFLIGLWPLPRRVGWRGFKRAEEG